MAYDEHLGERINRIMVSKGLSFHTKKMMGGLVFVFNEMNSMEK